MRYERNKGFFRTLSVSERMELLKEYKKMGFDYKDAIRDFDDGVMQYVYGGDVPKITVYNKNRR